jgi:proton-translocating NADH-quinone oxidoreductase chain N
VSGDLIVVLPLACLAGGAFAVYLVARLLGALWPAAHRDAAAGVVNPLLAALTALVFAVALVTWGGLVARTPFDVDPGAEPTDAARLLFPAWGYDRPAGVVLRAEPGALVLSGIALVLGLLVAVYSGRYLAFDRRHETYYPLLLLLVTGLVGMLLTADLFNLYMCCELMSLAAYALVGFRRRTAAAVEAGFKYLIMGSVGTIVLLMGISFLYRSRGHLALPAVATLSYPKPANRWSQVGLACVMVGLAVKSALVPLHTWLPDAHGRAPSSISALLSGIVIQSTFYAGVKVCLGLGFPARSLGWVLIWLSMVNMLLGNGMALVQESAKRLLAYSTVAQMGYVMLSIGIGMRYGAPEAVAVGFLLLLAHALMKGLAFLCKGACSFYAADSPSADAHASAEGESDEIEDLRGTLRRQPLVAIAFSLALAGLIGVPPLAGFSAKWFMLQQALRTASAPKPGVPPPTLIYVGLVVFGFNTVVSLGYFLPMIGAILGPPLLDQPETDHRVRTSAWMVVPLVILALAVIGIGVYPGPWLKWMNAIAAYLL